MSEALGMGILIKKVKAWTQRRHPYETGPEDKFPIKVNEVVGIGLGEKAAGPSRKLSDGVEVRPYEPIGRIDINSQLRPGEKSTDYYKRVMPQINEGLRKIADLAQTDQDLKKVVAFGAVSSLAHYAKNYGFDVFQIYRGGGEYESYADRGRDQHSRAVQDNPLFAKFANQEREQLEALMSRDKFISTFGTPPELPTERIVENS